MRAKTEQLIAGDALSGCLLIAEIGVNHNGRVEQALELVRAAHESGADAVKLQLFDPAALCSRTHRPAEYEMLMRYRLSDSDAARICRSVRERGLGLIATAFDEPSLDLLCRLDVPVIKVGSGEVTHTPLLEAVGRRGRPVILSTGGCTWADVDRAVHALRGAGCDRISLLHCVSAYPPPDEQTNLVLIPELRRRYPRFTIGLSDHSIGTTAAVAAVALGAQIIEKHLTLDCGADGPDHAASADPAMFAALAASVRRCERMLGHSEKSPQPCEGVIGRSIVAARDLPAGHVVQREDLAFKRPGSGLRPYRVDEVAGRVLLAPKRADDLLHAIDFGSAGTVARFVPSASLSPTPTPEIVTLG